MQDCETSWLRPHTDSAFSVIEEEDDTLPDGGLGLQPRRNYGTSGAGKRRLSSYPSSGHTIQTESSLITMVGPSGTRRFSCSPGLPGFQSQGQPMLVPAAISEEEEDTPDGMISAFPRTDLATSGPSGKRRYSAFPMGPSIHSESNIITMVGPSGTRRYSCQPGLPSMAPGNHVIINSAASEAWEPGPGDRPMYDGPDLPSSDLPEDHQGPEPEALPLDVTRLHKIQGYEDVGYHIQYDSAPPIPPPAVPEVDHLEDHHNRPEEIYSSVSHISDEQAREALLHSVAEHCCYGKAAARQMQIAKIIPSSAMHYTLETYTETRCTSWEQEPFTGQPVDGPTNGKAPPPWDIHANPTQTFHDETHLLEVPHTATLMPCHGCQALGWNRCHSCWGRGFKQCMYCHGNGRIWKTDAHGHRHTESCWHCHGTGRKRCLSCGGDGRVVCKTCGGFRQLKCFIRLTVAYQNHMVEHVIEHTDMPEHLVKNVGGELVFEQTQPRRQRLRAVPVSECTFNWRDSYGRFWVYGKEGRVYQKDYPQKCCCGCTVL